MRKTKLFPATAFIALIVTLLLLTACSKKAEGSTSVNQTIESTTENSSAALGEQSRDFTPEEIRTLDFFLNRKRDRMPGMFLICSYEKAEELDLSMVFYNGTSSSGIADLSEAVSAEEKSAVIRALGFDPMGLQPQKRPRTKLTAILKKYTALSEEGIAELIQNNPPTGLYVEEYDAYYSFYGDSEPISPQVKQARWLETEHLAQVEWEDTVRGWRGTAVMEKLESGWRFISNQLMP